MRKPIVQWAVCHRTPRGEWVPFTDTVRPRKRDAIAAYVGAPGSNGSDLYALDIKEGRAVPKRVEITVQETQDDGR